MNSTTRLTSTTSVLGLIGLLAQPVLAEPPVAPASPAATQPAPVTAPVAAPAPASSPAPGPIPAAPATTQQAPSAGAPAAAPPASTPAAGAPVAGPESKPEPNPAQPKPEQPQAEQPAPTPVEEIEGGEIVIDDSDTPEEADAEGLPLDDLRVFAEVFGRIKSEYVEDVDDRTLLGSAIRGMLSGLDPHSSYLDPDEYRDLQVGTTGEFGGLGIEVGMEDGFVKVIAPIDDTPAQRAGMQAGDLIVRIDEKPVKGMSLNDAVTLMRGKPGTSIELTVMREGDGNPIKIKLERDIIKVASVKTRTLEPGYGYVRIANFQARTTEDLLKAVADLKRDNKGALKGIVLDLRNNPGGVLNSAVGVSDAFLEQGLIVFTKGRVEDSKLEFKAGPDDILDGAPIVVLVNGGSASASEIVAGALQDQRRAIIMGSDTFGKGSVQTIVPIDDRTALKLTTARYYTPSGRSIQAQGIKPDIALERASVTLAGEAEVDALKEADLVRHLEEQAKPADTKPAAGEDASAPLATEDYQLSEALNVLKGLSIFSAYGRPAATTAAAPAAATQAAAPVPAPPVH